MALMSDLARPPTFALDYSARYCPPSPLGSPSAAGIPTRWEHGTMPESSEGSSFASASAFTFLDREEPAELELATQERRYAREAQRRPVARRASGRRRA
ncbi:hypothetical protein [Nocardia jiangxiensis]|uniref:Uncharacterized protein n=1 Tax=Nocardia jiangxiensis TaxID=282685 RepID=A0ABW6RTX8_9NOCA|nr:hypothetical protein [Nocardia jiangxiensis]